MEKGVATVRPGKEDDVGQIGNGEEEGKEPNKIGTKDLGKEYLLEALSPIAT